MEVVRSDSDFATKLVDEVCSSGIHIHRSPFKNKKIGILLFWTWFIPVYLKYKPSVIHSHTEVPDLALWIFRKVAWLFFWMKPRYIRTIHNTELWNDWKAIGRIVEKDYVHKKSNIAISLSTKELYERQYADKEIPIIYNGLEEVEQKPFSSIEKGKVNVLFAGRLERQKGIDELISVVSAFRDSNRYHFHIVGSGSYSEKLRNTLGGFSNVTLYEKIYALSQYLASFDYLFMPSNHEGLALMPIEASLAHVPAIINRCPGLVDTFPSDWPLAVDGNSVDAYIDIFENKLKQINRCELAERAYHFAKEHFSIAKMQSEYEKVYETKCEK